MKNTASSCLVCLFASVFMASTTCLIAEEAVPLIDPAAEALLKRVGEFYNASASFSCDVEYRIHTEMPGLKQDIFCVFSIALERPNKLAVRFKEGNAALGMTLVSDGEKVHKYSPATNRYNSSDAPATLEALLKGQIADGIIGTLGSTKVDAQLLKGLKEASILGTETLDNAACTRVRMVETEGLAEAWIQQGEQPLFRKFQVERIHKLPNKGGGPSPIQGSTEITAVYRNWKIAALPAEAFVFTPPEGAKEGVTGGGAQPEKHPLVGKPAPALSLSLLGGGTLDLASHTGKDVVILDFWATWCQPCVQALPTLSEMAADYKDKGVRFFAVNQREGADLLQDFLNEEKLSLTVALDPEGQGGELYEAHALPQTVIIGKDGIVQAVHVGLLSNLKQQLQGELNTLLSGKSLIVPAPAGEPVR
jgi:thiol-disulfide isomerase/thioredoxin